MPMRPLTAPAGSKGFTIIEPLVASVLIVLVMTATVSLLGVINRRTIFTRQQISMQESIDANLRQIRTLARQYTCCSGQCTTTPPTSFGVVGGVVQPCATNDWRDDRYYFPQVDLASTTSSFPNTTTPSEPLAVEQLCQNTTTANTHFMTPLKTAVDALEQPIHALRTSEIQSNKTLRLTYTDSINSREARVTFIRPMMANFCT